MAAITNTKLREIMDARETGLRARRREFEPGWLEVSNYTERWQSRHILGLGGRGNHGTARKIDLGGRANNRLFNSLAVRSMGTLRNGMSSGMSSPSSRWFKLAPADPELKTIQSVKEWTDDTTTRLYEFLAGTNIYTAMQSGYGELGKFGSEAGLMIRDWEFGAGCFALSAGEYWLGQNRILRADTLMRTADMTVAQLYDAFPDDTKFSNEVKRLKTQKKLDTIVPVMHLIEPNTERVYGKIDKTNKPYRSVYWEPGNDSSKDILSFGGFDQKPFWSPRWDIQGTDVYATGPGFDILPDGRKLQLEELRLQGAMDYLVKPPLTMPIQDRNAQVNLAPSGITFTSAADMAQGARPTWTVPYGAIPAISATIDKTERAIIDGSFSGLFMAISNMPGIQPRNVEEIVRRNEEQLAQLGPVVDRVQVEKLSVVVLQAFQIMSSAGLLMPVPDELNGKPINIEFIGILSQAQKMMELGKHERGLAFVGNMAGLFPTVIDIVDPDDMARSYFEGLGIPAKTLFSPEDVEAARQVRAQQAQQQQAMQMAPALKDMAGAAELMSRADERSPGALAALSPIQPGV